MGGLGAGEKKSMILCMCLKATDLDHMNATFACGVNYQWASAKLRQILPEDSDFDSPTFLASHFGGKCQRKHICSP